MELRLQTEDSAAVRPPNLVSVAFVLEIEILELVHELDAPLSRLEKKISICLHFRFLRLSIFFQSHTWEPEYFV